MIRASKTTAFRYERDYPGEAVHMDVKKLGRIPSDEGWRADGRGEGDNRDRKHGSGYDYVHSLVDDHSRQVFTSNDERANALAPWLEYDNPRRRHQALRGLQPISRLQATS